MCPQGSLSDRVSAALRELRAGTPVVYLLLTSIMPATAQGVGSDAWIGVFEEFDAGPPAASGLPAGAEPSQRPRTTA